MDDTIVAIATPLGEGGLGVIRLSGPHAFDVADRVFRSSKKISDAPSHTLLHGWIENNIDEAVAAVFRAPHSYTGEDVIEFSCHGSPAVLKETLRLCEAQGSRLAKPGEFTERAYLNGKLDLAQAEAVADLIHSQSSRARAAAAGQLRGLLSARIKDLRDQLLDLLAHLEANLDFAEEEVPIIDRTKTAAALSKIKTEIEELLSTSVKGRWLRDGLRVALAGKPNVGKSSLFNALLAENRAIVTSVPGTTRDTLEEKIEWDGLPVVLTDTAGIRETADVVESEGTARAASAHENADVVVLVFDGSLPLDAEDRRLADRLKNKILVVVSNKSDRGRVIDWPGALDVSAKENRGLAELKAAIVKSVGDHSPEREAALTITNMRHARQLELACERVQRAMDGIQGGETEEAVALDLRGSLEELGKITGEAVTEDVLSAIFRTFCIGK